MSDDDHPHARDEAPSFDEGGPRILALLRDSAVVLAAVTALLYLASHVYGAQYLTVFGVRSGFHGFGLVHLAMISLPEYIGLGAFTWIMYETLHARKRSRFVAGGVLLLAAIAARPVIVAYHGAGESSLDLDSTTISGLLLFGIFLYLRVKIAPQLQLIERRVAELDARCRNGEEHAGRVEPAARRAAEQAHHRSRRHRIDLGIACGVMTVVLVLPPLATLDAIRASRQDGYMLTAPPETSAPAAVPVRMPVYWIEDRLVYLTNTKQAGCRVHVQAGSTGESWRACTPLIEASLRARQLAQGHR